MIIKRLDFNAFSKLFLDKKALTCGICVNSTGTVDVLLDLNYNWRLVRDSVGSVAFWYCEDGESVWHCLGEVSTCDFQEITVC